MLTLEEIIEKLNTFWSSKGVLIGQPYGLEVGAGTSNPLTAFRVLGPEPFNVAYVEPSRRPADGRYGENPNRLQHYFQYQVILKPAPFYNTELYIEMLKFLGISPTEHDIRFVEDNWESPSLGAWGLGWEIWLNGMEITQYTYFQQMAGIDLTVPALEITIGLERLAMYLQNVDDYKNIRWNQTIKYGDIFAQHEFWQSTYNFKTSDIKKLEKLYQLHLKITKEQLKHKNYWAAYDNLLKLSHYFNLLDARGVISSQDRTARFKQMGKLSSQIAKLYLAERKRLKYPLLKQAKKIEYKPRSLTVASARLAANDRSTLIIELDFEELPAQHAAVLAQIFDDAWLEEFIKSRRYSYSEAHVYVTPRRIVIQIKGIPFSETKAFKIQGPPENIALKDNKPTQALLMFLAKNNLKHYKIEQGRVVAEKKLTLTVRDLAQEIVNEILNYKLDTKYQRWDQSDAKFIRPLRNILAIHGERKIKVKKFTVASTKTILSPRYINPAIIRVENVTSYYKTLEKLGIILSPQRREELIRSKVPTITNKAILEENVFLTESPKVVVSKLPSVYRTLPEKLIYKILETHQRYLVYNQGRSIFYAIVINHNREDKIQQIANQNTKVVKARLDDGLFYLKSDLKRDPKLYRRELKNVIYHPELGTYYDKVKRIKKLASVLLDTQDPIIKEVLNLIKNDKATLSGKEFPELEGHIISSLAKAHKYPAKVVKVLADYVENIPTTRLGKTIAVIDLVDDIAALSSLEGLPHGNTDPYHIRQKVYRLISILATIDLNIYKLLQQALKVANNRKVSFPEIKEYIGGRVKRKLNAPPEIAEGIARAENLNVYKQILLAKKMKSPEIVFDTAKRLYNILKQAESKKIKIEPDCKIDSDLFETLEEHKILELIKTLKGTEFLSYSQIMQIAKAADKFFATTLVFTDSKRLTRNRLCLIFKLKKILDTTFKYG